MGSLIVWEAANLFAGDDAANASNSKHLTLQSITGLSMRQKTVDHHPGGAIGAINLTGFGFEAMEMGFKLVGSDTQTKIQFGLGSGQVRPYTAYSVLRDKETGRAIERKAVIWGVMSEMTEDEFSRGSAGGQDHKIAEIRRFAIYEDKQEIYYFDFFASVWRVGGGDQLADARAILRI